MRDNGYVPRDSHDPVTPAVDSADSSADDELVVADDSERASSGVSEHEPIHEEVSIESAHEVRVRRTPRYGRFMILGGAVFAVAAFIATYSLPQEAGYDRNVVFGFVLLGSVAVGVGLGALAAIVAAAATKHTERTVVADRIDVRQIDATADDEAQPDLGELPAKVEGDEPAERPNPPTV